jgi:hypothetical protein
VSKVPRVERCAHAATDERRHMNDWAQCDLVWELAEETGLALTDRDRAFLLAVIGAGHSFTVIDTLLQIITHQRRTVSVELIDTIAEWVRGYADSDHAARLYGLLIAITHLPDKWAANTHTDWPRMAHNGFGGAVACRSSISSSPFSVAI